MVRSTSSINSRFQAIRMARKCSICFSFMYSSPFLMGKGSKILKEVSSDSALAREDAGVFFGVTAGMVGLLVLLLVWLVVVGLATLVFAIPVLLTLDLLPAEVLDTTFLAMAFADTTFFTPLAGVGLALANKDTNNKTLLPEKSSFLYQNPLVDARNV